MCAYKSVKRILFSMFLVTLFVSSVAGQLRSPDEFLGYQLGSRFSRHADVVAYFKEVAMNSNLVRLASYGKTYEGRELVTAIISSKENIARIEEIRKANLALTNNNGIQQKKAKQPAILWLSYNVHGNEASSTETAMQMLHALVKPSEQVAEWLKNVVVILDPCLNPDGRDRYVNFYTGASGKVPNADPQSREHNEPWPGGRTNHYYYDLNRDWAWQTQIESKQRVAHYQQWMPQVHVDFHEQSYNEPYYFAPAAEPVHQDITAWQREFQTIVGKKNAAYFDQNGWQYFTKERFDLLYPAYGDTYPLYNGAIGMTYEQGGIRAGLAVVTADGDTLTLNDRIKHHFTTGMATLEVVAGHTDKLLTEFNEFFNDTDRFTYKSYVVKGTNLQRVKKLAALLKANGIVYAFGSEKSLTGFSYETQKMESFKTERNDLIVSLKQSKAVLANVLLEPYTMVSDSNTYDITAWALPYAYGLNAYALKEYVNGVHPAPEERERSVVNMNNPYAWAFTWQGINDAKVLLALNMGGFKVRVAEEPFTAGNTSYPAGTLLIYRNENEKVLKQVAQRLGEIARIYGKSFVPIVSGYVEKGKDFGSNVYRLLKTPKIGVLAGPEVSAQNLGEVWHLLDQELNYPYTLLSPQSVSGLSLDRINVLILPDGSYGDKLADQLLPWVNAGGKLLVVEDAIGSFLNKKDYAIARKEVPKGDEPKNRTYSDKGRDNLDEAIPGAIFRVKLDPSNPLNIALGKYYYALKTDDKIYEPLRGGYGSGFLTPGSHVTGIAGKSILKKLDSGMLYGVQPLGRGSVVFFGTNVLFRSFWENGKQMFINGLLLTD